MFLGGRVLPKIEHRSKHLIFLILFFDYKDPFTLRIYLFNDPDI